MILVCVCGRALDDARVDGVWTIGSTTCEYRTCLHCGSTRAWCPVDVVPGWRVAVYRDPSTSEVAWEGDSFQDALDQDPTDRAEVIRNGVVLARGAVAPSGDTFWRVMAPQAEVAR